MKAYTIIKTTALILALITVSITTAAAISCDCGDICVNETGWWRDDGALNVSTTPIQTAVDNATAGETICVKAGNYTESVDIETAHLTILGEGADVVTVTAADSGDNIFEVTVNYVNISGFNVTGATGNVGIYLNGAGQCNISDNAASGNYNGIYLDSSSNNILLNNTVSNNEGDGIYLYESSDNLIHNNYFDNTYNAYDDGSNQWNTTVTLVTPGSNIIGGPSIGGNYWSDYECADTDGDGLGEEPYDIDGGDNSDYHPLCPPLSVKGDLNGDGTLTPADAAITLRLAATGAHDDAADVSGDGKTTSLDALMILQAAAEMVEL